MKYYYKTQTNGKLFEPEAKAIFSQMMNAIELQFYALEFQIKTFLSFSDRRRLIVVVDRMSIKAGEATDA